MGEEIGDDEMGKKCELAGGAINIGDAGRDGAAGERDLGLGTLFH